MPYALVSGNEPRVYQIAADPFDVAEPYHWVRCKDGTTEFCTFNGSGFDAPAEPVRHVSGYLLLRSLTDEQADKLKARDVARLSARGTSLIPETSPFVARVASVAGFDPASWFSAALKSPTA